MRRSILLAAALLMAIPALGAAQTAKDEPAKTGATAAQKGKKSPAAKKGVEPKKPLPRSPASPASKSSSTSKVSASAAADRAAMLRARATFRYAADACVQGAAAACDKDLLEDAQQAFMLTCRVCAPVEKCEAEKAQILEGKQNTTTDLCVP